ncbi:hypothetical protein RIF29_21714 [Crotalaria pallida]|uniref:Uncharacterized protein n=1 Tax=Crotalaria pallida TaxID=3830 RepID=A0AAN9F5U6_CROPI
MTPRMMNDNGPIVRNEQTKRREKEDDVARGDDGLASNAGGEEGCSDNNKDDDAVRRERKKHQNNRKKSRRRERKHSPLIIKKKKKKKKPLTKILSLSHSQIQSIILHLSLLKLAGVEFGFHCCVSLLNHQSLINTHVWFLSPSSLLSSHFISFEHHRFISFLLHSFKLQQTLGSSRVPRAKLFPLEML